MALTELTPGLDYNHTAPVETAQEKEARYAQLKADDERRAAAKAFKLANDSDEDLLSFANAVASMEYQWYKGEQELTMGLRTHANRDLLAELNRRGLVTNYPSVAHELS